MKSFLSLVGPTVAATLVAIMAPAHAQANEPQSAEAAFAAYEARDAALVTEWQAIANTSDITAELNYRAARDQLARAALIEMVAAAGGQANLDPLMLLSFAKRLKQIDQENTAWLKDQLKVRDWFTISEFGDEASTNAFLIAQHATADPTFMRDVLERFERLYPQGEVRGEHYALLFDRNAAMAGLPQTYGTQWACIAGSRQPLTPIDEETEVDSRRAKVGLEPLGEYVAKLPPC